MTASVRSLRHHHPDDRIVVHVSEPDDRVAEAGAEARTLSNLRYSFADKIQAIVDEMESGTSDLLVFLDGDTWVVGNIEPALELMERFDLAAAHAPRRMTRDYDDVPVSFPELNTGVLVMRRCESVARLMRSWLTAFLEDVTAGSVPASQDQPSLRRLLYRSDDVRLAVLTPEYNCRFNMGVSVDGDVRILHGRWSSLENVADLVNCAPVDRHHGGPSLRVIRDDQIEHLSKAADRLGKPAGQSSRSAGHARGLRGNRFALSLWTRVPVGVRRQLKRWLR